MYCPRCGNPCRPGTQYCPECGIDFSETASIGESHEFAYKASDSVNAVEADSMPVFAEEPEEGSHLRFPIKDDKSEKECVNAIESEISSASGSYAATSQYPDPELPNTKRKSVYLIISAIIAVICIVAVFIVISISLADGKSEGPVYLLKQSERFDTPNIGSEKNIYEYDLDNLQYTVESPGYTSKYKLDEFGNVIQCVRSDELGDTILYSIEYELQLNGENLPITAEYSATNSVSGQIAYGYDGWRRISESEISAYSYGYSTGHETQYSPNGFPLSYISLDEEGNPIDFLYSYSYSGGTSDMPEYCTTGALRFHLIYDEDGNLTQVYKSVGEDGEEWLYIQMSYELHEDCPIGIRTKNLLKPLLR